MEINGRLPNRIIETTTAEEAAGKYIYPPKSNVYYHYYCCSKNMHMLRSAIELACPTISKFRDLFTY